MALTSEIIWDELIELKKEKPIVVSMGMLLLLEVTIYLLSLTKFLLMILQLQVQLEFLLWFQILAEFSKRIGINAEQVETNKNSIFIHHLRKPHKNFRLDVKRT